MFQIEGLVEQELHRLCLLRAPHEAVGLIIGDRQVVELTNWSKSPNDSFEIHKADIVTALTQDFDITTLTIWHSHPSGGVGPSRIDMQQKVPNVAHLVITLVDGELVYSWY